jgi:hypothetical protein
MLSVGRAAEAIIWEVRRQFKAHPELKDENFVPVEGSGVPDYAKCVDISTQYALLEMVVPGGLAIFSPPAIGYLLGSRCLVGLLVGALCSGVLLAVMMATAGGAWDNAKKWVEKKGLGADKGKGTKYHAAVVCGDTVGDPFKDTSGPALNILLKMMSLISLVLAPSFKNVNPMGDAFDADSWYIGLILIIVVGGFLIYFSRYASNSYKSMEEDFAAASPTTGATLTGGTTATPAAATSTQIAKQ